EVNAIRAAAHVDGHQSRRDAADHLIDSPEPYVAFDLQPHVNLSNLVNFQNEWHAVHTVVKQQSRVGTAALMWRHLEDYTVHLQRLHNSLLESRRMPSDDTAPLQHNSNGVSPLPLATIDGNVYSIDGHDVPPSTTCACCGLPTHHMRMLHSCRREMDASVRTILSYWALLRPTTSSLGLGVIESVGADTTFFLQWALGAGSAWPSRQVLLQLTCDMMTHHSRGGGGELRSSSDLHSNSSIHCGSHHADPRCFLDSVHCTISNAIEALHFTHQALRTYAHVSHRLLRLWTPGVSRDVLMREIAFKKTALWETRILPALTAYEDHQVTIALLQYVARTAHREHAKMHPTNQASGEWVLRDGFASKAFREVQLALLECRRTSRKSFLFYVFPPWVKEAPERGHTESKWLRLSTFARHVTAVADRTCEFVQKKIPNSVKTSPLLKRVMKKSSVPFLPLQSPLPPTVPTLDEILRSFRLSVGVEDYEPNISSNATVLAQLSDLNAIIEHAENGVHRLHRQLSESRYFVSHLVGKHSFDKEPRLLHLLATHVSLLSQGPLPGSDDQTIATLISHESESIARVTGCLAHAVAELMFCYGAQRLLDHCPDVTSPLELQLSIWQDEHQLSEWSALMKSGDDMLRHAAHNIEKQHQHKSSKSRDSQNSGALDAQLKYLLQSSVPLSTQQSLPDYQRIVSIFSDAVLLGALSSSWADFRTDNHRPLSVPQSYLSAEMIGDDPLQGQQKAALLSWRRSSKASEKDSCVLDALLALDTFRCATQEVTRASSVEL
ncbi:Hypothetical protein, putative, partial [Bodo saltans]